MPNIILVSLLCFAFSGAVSAAAPPMARPETYSFSSKSHNLELVKPNAVPNRQCLGGRFMKAGWIVGLQSAITGKQFLRTKPVWPGYPAFGCTQEFTPSLELSKTDAGLITALKVGVGTIVFQADDPFHPKLTETFPWKTSFELMPDGFVIHNRQSCKVHPDLNGYAYEFHQKIHISSTSPDITYQQTLKNTGSRKIDVENYVHPFFNSTDKSGYRLPGGTDTPIGSLNGTKRLAPSRQKSVTALLDGESTFTISSDRFFTQVIIWQMLKQQCFAVEPFIPIKLEPGESTTWTWILETQ
jgi:hypothetical protein